MTGGFKYSHDPEKTLRTWASGLNRIRAFVESIRNAVKWGRYDPTVDGNGSMTFTSQQEVIGSYIKFFNICFVSVQAEGTTGGTANAEFTCSLPFPVSVRASTRYIFSGITYDSSLVSAVGYLAPDTSRELVYIQRYDRAVYGLGSGRHFRFSGFYEVD